MPIEKLMTTNCAFGLVYWICIEQIIFSFVLAKFYEMEDIIATTSVNAVTQEIFDRQSLNF